MAPPIHALRRWMTLGLWTTLGLTLWSLPSDAFPPVWIAAFTLPAWLFLLLGQLPWLHVFWRLLLCTCFQIAAAYMATELAGNLQHAPALACTLLPPTTYVALRRHDSDVPLALFLGFCLQLVGIMLGRVGFDARTAIWIATAAWTLHLESRLSTYAKRQRFVTAREPRVALRALTLLLGLSCAVLALGSFRLLSLIPERGEASAPEERPKPDPTSASPTGSQAQVGLSNSFDLGAASPGSDLSLRYNQLVRVTGIDGPLPSGIYLRTAGFHAAGLAGWGPGPVNRRPLAADARIRDALDNAPTREFALERFGAQNGVVYVPPGAVRILADGVVADPARGELFEPDAAGDLKYEIVHQLHDVSRQMRLVRDRALTSLPEELRTELFSELSLELRSRATMSDLEDVCTAIAEMLGERCRYARKEPVGPYDAPLLNFLFGERHGYCMHFASAAAILLRAEGFPARVAVGVYGGEVDPSLPDTRSFGSQHGHAWVEIPTSDRGWVVFDPTPPDSRATGDVPGLGQALGIDDEPEPEEPSWWAQVPLEVWMWVGGAVVLALWWFRPRGQRRSVAVDAKKAWPARQMLVQILRTLGKRGLPRSNQQTLEQYERDLHRRLGALGHRLDPKLSHAFAAYQAVRFGGRDWDDQHERALREGVDAAAAVPDARRQIESQPT